MDVHTFNEQSYFWCWDLTKGGWSNASTSLTNLNNTNMPSGRSEVALAVAPVIGSSDPRLAVMYGGYSTSVCCFSKKRTPGGKPAIMNTFSYFGAPLFSTV